MTTSVRSCLSYDPLKLDVIVLVDIVDKFEVGMVVTDRTDGQEIRLSVKVTSNTFFLSFVMSSRCVPISAHVISTSYDLP